MKTIDELDQLFKAQEGFSKIHSLEMDMPDMPEDSCEEPLYNEVQKDTEDDIWILI